MAIPRKRILELNLKRAEDSSSTNQQHPQNNQASNERTSDVASIEKMTQTEKETLLSIMDSINVTLNEFMNCSWYDDSYGYSIRILKQYLLSTQELLDTKFASRDSANHLKKELEYMLARSKELLQND